MPRIHDDEVDTGEPVVRALLREQTPQWADLPLRALDTTGTDHAVSRLGDDLVVRVPRTERAAASLQGERASVRRVDGLLPVEVPGYVHDGRPGAGYPYPWGVLRWVDGEDAWTARDGLDEPAVATRLAEDLAAAVVSALRAAPTDGVRRRDAGRRGGPLEGVLHRIDLWLGGGEGPLPPGVDEAAVREVVAAATVVTDAAPYGDGAPYVLTHGDLIPGNLVVHDGRLVGVIDWGYLSAADPALDLVAAWAVVAPSARPRFRELVAADDATWERARLNALEQALGAVVYYTPRRHPLADVMTRTLARILEDRD